MKYTRFLFALAATGTLILGSCKNSTGPKGGGGNQVVMTATVNGRAWSGIIPFTGYNNGYQDFSAGDSNSDIAIYYIQTDTGTYPINGNTGDSCFATYDRGQNLFISHTKSGTIHFTTLTNHLVAGTFNFVATDTMKDSIKITNGTFNISK